MADPTPEPFDLLIVGGGINGVGIARDAAGRGLKVVLVEQGDLAAHTSSASTKLIHGGLRYLEHGEFRLVRESLLERARLLKIAPHIVSPLDFVVLQSGAPRAAWLVRLGLLIYDALGGRMRLSRSRRVALGEDIFGAGLRHADGPAFVYCDCRVDDSRLVILNALDAAVRGAEVRTRTELVRAERQPDHWTATLRDRSGEHQMRARVIVNAAGPWVSALFERLDGVRPPRPVRLVKGSHIVVPRLFEGEHAYVIQNPDGRMVFAIPFERQFTLVGTTDCPWTGPPATPAIDQAETSYLLDTVARTFSRPVAATDIRWTYSGIRPLVDDGARRASAVTRDYVLELDGSPGRAALLSIFGGKLTTYRRLAERALHRLTPYLPDAKAPWTDRSPLPGGGFAGTLESYRESLIARYPELPPTFLRRLAASYGDRAERIIAGVRTLADLGELFGSDLTQREIDYLIAHEWARSAEDILFRRSKLGLHIPEEAATRLGAYLQSLMATD